MAGRESGNGIESNRENLDYKTMSLSDLVKHLDDAASREQINARVVFRSAALIAELTRRKLTKEIKGAEELGTYVKELKDLLFVGMGKGNQMQHNAGQAGEVWKLFNEIEHLTPKVARNLKQHTSKADKALAEQKATAQQAAAPTPGSTNPAPAPTTRSANTPQAPVAPTPTGLPSAPSAAPTGAPAAPTGAPASPAITPGDTGPAAPTFEKYESADTDRAKVKALEDRLTAAKDAYNKANNPLSGVDMLKQMQQDFGAKKDAIEKAISDLEAKSKTGEDVAAAKKSLADSLADLEKTVSAFEATLSQPQTPAAPPAPAAQTEQEKRKAETADEMNARIKASTHRVAYNRDWKGEKDLDKKIDSATGEHPLKKRGAIIEAIDAHYKSGNIRKGDFTTLGARMRGMLGINASKLPAELLQKKNEAEAATQNYINQLEGDYTKRLDARVAAGSMKPERREELMAKFRVMMGNRFAIKYEERILEAEKASLPENQRNALASVMRAYARAPKIVKMGIATGVIAGTTAAFSGLAAVATTAVVGKIAWRNIMIGTGLGTVIGSGVMRAATSGSQKEFLRAKEDAQTMTGGSWKDRRAAIRSGAQFVQRGKVAGYASAALVGGASSAFASDVWNDTVDASADSTPTVTPEAVTQVPAPAAPEGATPEQNAAALDALRTQLEVLHPTVNDVVKTELSTSEYGPRVDTLPSATETTNASPSGKIVDRVLPIEKFQDRILPDAPPVTEGGEVEKGGGKIFDDRVLPEQEEDSRLDKEEGEREETEPDSVEGVDIHTVAKGEHIWGISEKHFPELLDQLPDGHARDVALMQLRDVLSANNGEILKEVGGTSNHADIINPGDHIELAKLEGHLQRIVEKMTELKAPELPQDLSLGRTEIASVEGMKVPGATIEEPPVPSSHLTYTPPQMVQVAEVSTNEIPKPIGTVNDAVKDAMPAAPAAESAVNSAANAAQIEDSNKVADAALGASGALVGTAALNQVSGEARSRIIGESREVSSKDLIAMRKRILGTIESRGFLGSLMSSGKSFYDQFKATTLDDLENNYLAKKRGGPVEKRTLASSISASGVDTDTFDTWMNNLERWKTVVPFVKTKTLEQYVDDVAKYLIQTGQKV